MRLIHKTKGGRYFLIKKIKGKHYNFGTYSSLEEAKKYRDYFESKGWRNCLDERLNYSTSKHPNRYITKHKESYRIFKKVKGETCFFGTYKSLEKAQEIRDYFERTGWNLNERLLFSEVDYVSLQRGKYVIRKTIDGKREWFSQWDDRETAIEEANLLKRCNWDWDALCEGIDERVDGEIKVLDGVRKAKSTFQTHPNGRNDWFEMSRGKNPIYRGKI